MIDKKYFMNDSYPLYLFAKSPIAGKVKTRMQPHLNSNQSANLAEKLIHDSIDTCLSYWPGRVILAVTPNMTHPVFVKLGNNKKLRLELQVEGNLGDRLYHTLQKGIDQSDAAVVMGCDIPHIDKEILQKVWDTISMGNNVIGPTHDSGFYILGMTTYNPLMFSDICWGGNQVFKKTLDNFASLNIVIKSCTTLRDIDNWDDLQWLAKRDISYRSYLR